MTLQQFIFKGYCSDWPEEHYFSYKLIDDELGIFEGITTGPRWIAVPIGFGVGAIIDFYRNRNLNVEGNVALYLLQKDLYKMSNLIRVCQIYFPQWAYVNENKLKKYIVFS